MISRRSRNPKVTAGLKGPPRDRAIDQNQHGEDGPGRKRIAEKGNGVIAVGQGFAHDAGPHHGGQQKECAEEFGGQAPGESRLHGGEIQGPRARGRQSMGASCYWFTTGEVRSSFPDAEPPEDLPEQVVGSEFAGQTA